MHKKLLLLPLFALVSCSTTTYEMQSFNKSPRGITIVNVAKHKQSNAYQAAESHCAKYNKVPRILKSVQEQADDSNEKMNTITFECVKPSR